MDCRPQAAGVTIAVTSRHRFLDPARIEAALTEAADVAKKGRVKVALAGGVALQLYGSDRFTADLDLVADRYPSDIKRRDVLTFGGVRTALSGVPVDFIVRDDQYADLYDEAIERAQRVAGVPVPVVTLPYLAAMKMAAGRGKDEQDLHFILSRPGVSYRAIREVIARHLGPYAGDELDAIRTIAAWEKRAGRRAPRGKRRA